jgi:hypothetical protein
MHGSLECKDLIKYNLSLPEQRAAAHEKGVFSGICPILVRDATAIIESIWSTY